MSTKFLTAFTFPVGNIQKEKNNGKRITVTGQAYTCRELIEKHKVGQMPSVQNYNLMYSDNTIVGNPIDIVEIQNAQREVDFEIKQREIEKENQRTVRQQGKEQDAPPVVDTDVNKD